MAKKGRYFSIGPKQFDAKQFGKAMKKELEQDAEVQAVRLVNAIVSDITELIEDLNENTTNRGRGINTERYNQPFKDATDDIEILERKKTVRGVKTYNYIVRVNNVKFNALDTGHSGFRAAKDRLMRFPMYEGKLTRPNSLDVQNDVDILPSWVSVSVAAPVEARNWLPLIIRERTEDFTKRPQVLTTFTKGRMSVTLLTDEVFGKRIEPRFKYDKNAITVKLKRSKSQ